MINDNTAKLCQSSRESKGNAQNKTLNITYTRHVRITAGNMLFSKYSSLDHRVKCKVITVLNVAYLFCRCVIIFTSILKCTDTFISF
jgi:hypothetical protein